MAGPHRAPRPIAHQAFPVLLQIAVDPSSRLQAVAWPSLSPAGGPAACRLQWPLPCWSQASLASWRDSLPCYVWRMRGWPCMQSGRRASCAGHPLLFLYFCRPGAAGMADRRQQLATCADRRCRAIEWGRN